MPIGFGRCLARCAKMPSFGHVVAAARPAHQIARGVERRLVHPVDDEHVGEAVEAVEAAREFVVEVQLGDDFAPASSRPSVTSQRTTPMAARRFTS